MNVQLFLAVTSGKSWPIHQTDTNNAFHGHLDGEIYMLPPEDHFKVEMMKFANSNVRIWA